MLVPPLKRGWSLVPELGIVFALCQPPCVREFFLIRLMLCAAMFFVAMLRRRLFSALVTLLRSVASAGEDGHRKQTEPPIERGNLFPLPPIPSRTNTNEHVACSSRPAKSEETRHQTIWLLASFTKMSRTRSHKKLSFLTGSPTKTEQIPLIQHTSNNLLLQLPAQNDQEGGCEKWAPFFSPGLCGVTRGPNSFDPVAHSFLCPREPRQPAGSKPSQGTAAEGH